MKEGEEEGAHTIALIRTKDSAFRRKRSKTKSFPLISQRRKRGKRKKKYPIIKTPKSS